MLHASTFLCFSADWNLSWPCAVVLTRSWPWSMQLVSIVTSVVGCWWVLISVRPDVAILWFMKSAADVCKENCVGDILRQSKIPNPYFCSSYGTPGPLRTNCRHADISWSLNHAARIHSHSCSMLSRGMNNQTPRPFHSLDSQVCDSCLKGTICIVVNHGLLGYRVFNLDNGSIWLTSISFAADRGLSVPSAIVLTFPGVCTL